MPKTKFQGTIFGLIMSYAMAIGMEVYNIAIKEGFTLKPGGFSSMTNHVFLDALLEASYMAFFWNMFAAAPFTHWLFERIFSPDRETAIEKNGEPGSVI